MISRIIINLLIINNNCEHFFRWTRERSVSGIKKADGTAVQPADRITITDTCHAINSKRSKIKKNYCFSSIYYYWIIDILHSQDLIIIIVLYTEYLSFCTKIVVHISIILCCALWRVSLSCSSCIFCCIIVN